MRRLLFVLILLVTPCMIMAQTGDADLNILLGSPQNDFRDNLDRTAVGLNGSLAFAVSNSPVHLGLELGIMIYGQDRRTENFNPNIPEVRVDVITDYDIFTAHALFRYESPTEVVKPYVDGLVGLQYLFTRTKISDRDDFDEIASETNFDDTAFSYGIGGGFKFRVYNSASSQAFINFKTRYLLGGEADYLQPGSIEVNNGVLTFDESTSETDLLTLHLGVALKF